MLRFDFSVNLPRRNSIGNNGVKWRINIPLAVSRRYLYTCIPEASSTWTNIFDCLLHLECCLSRIHLVVPFLLVGICRILQLHQSKIHMLSDPNRPEGLGNWMSQIMIDKLSLANSKWKRIRLSFLSDMKRIVNDIKGTTGIVHEGWLNARIRGTQRTESKQ